MENKPKFKPDPKLKLMDQVRQVLHQPIEEQLEPVKAGILYGCWKTELTSGWFRS
jgi:hypothetical protein